MRLLPSSRGNPASWLVGAVLVVVLLGIALPCRADVPRTAFFYGKPVPTELFAHYDRVVVDADNLAAPPSSMRGEAFAYVSVGEIADAHALHKHAPRETFVARNADWKSDVADLTRTEWHAFVLDRLIEPLWERGYRGFFLDTLDSFELAAKTPDAKKAQTAGLAALLGKLTKRHPTIKLVLNRGFDVVAAVRPNVVAMAVESLFAGWDSKTKKFVTVSKDDREWLLARLAEVKNKHKLPVTVIDYLPHEDTAGRRDTAKKIVQLGYDAWVARPSLDDLGVGQAESVPRRVLVVHGGDQLLGIDDAHVVAAAIIERMGYAVDYVNRKTSFPSGNLAARYAGVIALLSDYDAPRTSAYRTWLLERVREGMPIALLESFGVPPDADLLRELGLEAAAGDKSVRVTTQAPWIGYETQRIDIGKALPEVRAVGPGVTSFLRLEDAKGKTGDGVVIGPWGGVVLAPYFMSGGDSSTRRFVVDPWTFFAKALRLEPMPILDPTTEGGQRILTAHIDGDGFASRAEVPGTPFAGQVIHDQIITRFKIPTTVSIIEGELSPQGMQPADSPALEKLAQATFRLPYVEIASHSFSHPFYWAKAEHWKMENGKPAHLAIPGYRFDLQRDVLGSVDYIHQRLAPPGKRVKVFLWTGDCLPSQEAVAMVKGAGLLNLNGGGATQIVGSTSLTQLQAIMLTFPNGALQVYGPIQNDNVFTNHWTGPYHGFRRVIETLRLTESPRRVAPLSIYYHYFSGTKQAGVKALSDIYEWAMTQETHPLFASQYAERVEAFAKASIARRLDGTWELVGLGAGRTLRIDPALGFPDLRRSKGVAGVRDAPVGRWATLTGDRVEIAFAPSLPSEPYIERSNAEVLSFRPEAGGRVKLRLRGNVPIAFGVGGAKRACTLKAGKRDIAGVASGAVVHFTLAESDTGEATLVCP